MAANGNIWNSTSTLETVGYVISSVLKSGKLNVCSINIQSITANLKLSELKILLHRSKINILVVTETWANKKVDDVDLQVDGYKLFRHDRVHKRGGGIAVYVKDGISCGVVERSTRSVNTEYLFLELHLQNDKLLLCSVYNPPRINCVSLLEEKFRTFCQLYDDIIIAGDLNKDYLTSDSNTLRALFDSFNLCNHVIAPTHFTRTSATLIDYMVSASNDKVLGISQIDYSSFSGHDIIFCCFDYNVAATVDKLYHYRNYNRFSVLELNNAIDNVNWSQYFLSVNPNEMVDFFNHKLHDIHDTVFPVRNGRNDSTPCPWFDNNIKKAMIDRDLAYTNWKVSRDPVKHNIYKKLRNKANTIFRDAKNNFLLRQLNPNLPGKVLWKRLADHRVIKSKSLQEIEFSPDIINDYFIDSIPESLPQINSVVPSNNANHFSFRLTNQSEISKALFSIKSNATGLDELPLKFLQIVFPFLSLQFEHLFNYIILTGIFPDKWKVSKVIPIKKKNNCNAISNLRPISILPVVAKTFELVLKSQMINFIESNNLLTDFQSGYRSKHSTTTAILKITNDILSMLDRKYVSILILLDFSKAFDSLNHDLLCSKLFNIFKFNENAVRLIESYLNNRSQKVYVNGLWSCAKTLSCGVPQGSILGPLLFSLFINDVTEVLSFCKYHMYADDIQIYHSGKGENISDLCEEINRDLSSILNWSENNALHLNASKTKAMLIQKSNLIPVIASLFVGSSQVEIVSSCTNLGFVFDSNMSWDNQVSATCGKIYGTLRALRRFHNLSQGMKLKLFKSLILPHFNYGDILMLSISETNRVKLNVALNDCIRFIYNLRLGDHVTHLQKNLIGCPFLNYFKYRSVLFMHKLILTREPGYLYDRLNISSFSRTCRLIVPINRTALYNASFFVRGVSVYNSLPSSLKAITSLSCFGKRCLIYFNS